MGGQIKPWMRSKWKYTSFLSNGSDTSLWVEFWHLRGQINPCVRSKYQKKPLPAAVQSSVCQKHSWQWTVPCCSTSWQRADVVIVRALHLDHLRFQMQEFLIFSNLHFSAMHLSSWSISQSPSLARWELLVTNFHPWFTSRAGCLTDMSWVKYCKHWYKNQLFYKFIQFVMPPDHNSQPKKSLIFANYYLHAMDHEKKQKRRKPSSVLYSCNSQRRLKEFCAVQLRSHKATFHIYFKSFIWNVFKI